MRANDLVKTAEQATREGNIKNALTLYNKALEILLNGGHYMRVSEVFSQMIATAQVESQLLPITDQIQSTIATVEALDLPEEVAKLKLALANLSYKSADYINAATLFTEVATLFFQVEPEEYRQASGIFLLRAAESLEKIGRTEKAEKLVMDALRRFDVSNFNYLAHFNNLKQQIDRKKYAEAIETIREIALFFRNLEADLENMPEDFLSLRILKRNVEARLIHMFSEYNLLKMMCYRHLGNEEKVKEQADKSIKDLNDAIDYLKEEIKESFFSSADLHRLTFDLFMVQAFQEFADYQIEDPIDMVTRGLPAEVVAIITKMKFYDFTQQVLKQNLRDQVESLKNMPLSQILSPFRDFIFKTIAMWPK